MKRPSPATRVAPNTSAAESVTRLSALPATVSAWPAVSVVAPVLSRATVKLSPAWRSVWPAFSVTRPPKLLPASVRLSAWLPASKRLAPPTCSASPARWDTGPRAVKWPSPVTRVAPNTSAAESVTRLSARPASVSAWPALSAVAPVPSSATSRLSLPRRAVSPAFSVTRPPKLLAASVRLSAWLPASKALAPPTCSASPARCDTGPRAVKRPSPATRVAPNTSAAESVTRLSALPATVSTWPAMSVVAPVSRSTDKALASRIVVSPAVTHSVPVKSFPPLSAVIAWRVELIRVTSCPVTTPP